MRSYGQTPAQWDWGPCKRSGLGGRGRGKTAVYKAGREGSEETSPADTSMLDLQPPD